MAHTNGMESHWALFKRGIDGIYHHVSVKHLPRYTTEFEGRHNSRVFSFSCLVGKAHHVESFAEMGIVAA